MPGQLLPRLAAVMLFASVYAGTTQAATFAEQLAAFGHPAQLCRYTDTKKGLGELLVVQFEPKSDDRNTINETAAILELMADSLQQSEQFYVGFDTPQDWKSCQSRYPGYVYWRDHDYNWRSISGTPRKYLEKKRRALPEQLQGTPAEAFILFSLGIVERRLERPRRGFDMFRASYGILKNTDDPNGLKPLLLEALVGYHFGPYGNEAQGQQYLDDYALMVKRSPDQASSFLPMVKVAPVYPREAMRKGIGGYALLEFTVDADGRVKDPVIIEQSPANLFGKAAVAAALKFRYIPAVANGKRVAVHGVRNKIAFALED